MFKYLKKKLIDMGFLCHTPKSALSCQDKKDIKQYGLIHFTFSENINEISKNGVMPGKEYLYRKEKNLCWFYINYPKEYEKNLGIVKSKGKKVTRPPKVRPKKSSFGGRYFYVKIQL